MACHTLLAVNADTEHLFLVESYHCQELSYIMTLNRDVHIIMIQRIMIAEAFWIHRIDSACQSASM